MKRLPLFFYCLALVGGIVSLLAAPLYGEEKGFLEVRDAAVCLDVVDHVCVDASDIFPAKVDKLYCLTRIVGAQDPTEITHVWYFGDIERARIKLDIRSVSFRTYTSKRIQPHEIGDWRVDVLNSEENVLQTMKFEIVP